MTGFEPRTSGVGSDRSTNCATTTSRIVNIVLGKVLVAFNDNFC